MTMQTRSVLRQQIVDQAAGEVEKAGRAKGVITAEWVAHRILDGYLDAPMSLAELQTEIIPLALNRGVRIEYATGPSADALGPHHLH